MQGRKEEMRGIQRQCGSQRLVRALPPAALSTEKLMFSGISTANAEEHYSLDHLEEYNKRVIQKAGRYIVNLTQGYLSNNSVTLNCCDLEFTFTHWLHDAFLSQQDG